MIQRLLLIVLLSVPISLILHQNGIQFNYLETFDLFMAYVAFNHFLLSFNYNLIVFIIKYLSLILINLQVFRTHSMQTLLKKLLMKRMQMCSKGKKRRMSKKIKKPVIC